MSGPPLPPLRDVIARHGLSASKALGQNFLLDEQLLDRIAAIPGDLEDKAVLEIGPGPGGLTRALLRAGARVTAVERDARCLPALAELAEAFPGRLRTIEGDALALDHDALMGEPYAIVANLPYNGGTELFVRWMSGEEWPPGWTSLTLMFQQEVARRICAQPDTSEYGRLSVLAQWRAEAKLAMKVHRSAFTPPPKVMSAIVFAPPKVTSSVVAFGALTTPLDCDPRALERVTAAAFGQRRKMLRQSLKSLPQGVDVLERLGIDPQRRAETLSINEFVNIARELS